MASGDLGVEVVAIAIQDFGCLVLQHAVEQDLRDLGHAADGLAVEVLQVARCPGGLVSSDTVGAVRKGGEHIEHVLDVCLDKVDTLRL